MDLGAVCVCWIVFQRTFVPEVEAKAISAEDELQQLTKVWLGMRS